MIRASPVSSVQSKASARATYAASYALRLSPQLPHPLEHGKRAVARNAEATIPLEKLPPRAAVQLSTTHPAANRACDLSKQDLEAN